MYIYVGKEISNPIYIHFLCGCKFCDNEDIQAIHNKRKVLENFLRDMEYHYPVILEELFVLREYEDNKLGSLADVEYMISKFATTIIIMHETYSTAAELGLFSGDNSLCKKIISIYPKEASIKRVVNGFFIKEAIYKGKNIRHREYGFEVYQNPTGYNEFYTYFENNAIPVELQRYLKSKISDNCEKRIDVRFYNNYYKVSYNNCYDLNNQHKTIRIILSYQCLMYTVLSILLNQNLIKDKRDIKTASKELSDMIKNIFLTTIAFRETIDIKEYTSTIKMEDKKEINIPIRFLLSILIKIGLIELKENKIIVKKELKLLMSNEDKILNKIEESDFFGGYNGNKEF